MGVGEYRKVAAAASAAGIREIDILGGEPTLYHALEDLIDTTLDSGLSLNLSSNGGNVPLLRRLSEKYRNKPVNIGISVNDIDPSNELHEYILEHKPYVKSVYMKGYGVPQSAIPYINADGIDYFLLYRDAVREEELSETEYFHVYYRELSKLKALHPNVEGVFCPGFISDSDEYPQLKDLRCPAGTTKLSILPDGSVYPCYLFFSRPHFRLGNILDDSLDSILESPLLDFFRRFEGNQCDKNGCELSSRCHGGCPAVSLLVSGSLTGPDPRCSFQKVLTRQTQ